MFELGIDPGGGSGIPTDQRVALILLGGMLLSFGFIRMSARLMRSPKVPWWPGSVTSGDLHIHHLVFGIILLLLTGFLGFAITPGSPWIEILAALFGIGAGLTLDEFALWLHLEDVYWSDEGRRSVDAVAIAVLVAALVITASPIDSTEEEAGAVLLVGYVLVRLVFSLLAVVKGKYVLGLVGLFIPLFAEVGAIRLARPHSPWARWRYRGNPEKQRKAVERDQRWNRRRDRLRDLIGGAPSVALADRAEDEKSSA
jgi:hypothetical protein